MLFSYRYGDLVVGVFAVMVVSYFAVGFDNLVHHREQLLVGRTEPTTAAFRIHFMYRHIAVSARLEYVYQFTAPKNASPAMNIAIWLATSTMMNLLSIIFLHRNYRQFVPACVQSGFE
jgi:hypothetical protein